SKRDWSSDVCSSDLEVRANTPQAPKVPVPHGPMPVSRTRPDAESFGRRCADARASPFLPERRKRCRRRRDPARTGATPQVSHHTDLPDGREAFLDCPSGYVKPSPNIPLRGILRAKEKT